MSKIKKGRFSQYQFSKQILNRTTNWRSDVPSVQKKGKVYEINQLQNFYQKTAKINALCAQRIQTTRNRMENAFANYTKRIRQGSFFINYKENPFLTDRKKNPSPEITIYPNTTSNQLNNQMTKNPFFKKEKNLIESLNNLSSRSQDNIYDKRLASKKIVKSKKYDQMSKTPQPKSNIPMKKKQLSIIVPKERKFIPQIVRKVIPQVTPQKVASFKQQITQQDDNFADLDRIYNLNDFNFFEQQLRKKQVNIFEVLHIEKGQGFTKKRVDILVENKFCFESVLDNFRVKRVIKVEQHIDPVYKRTHQTDSNEENKQVNLRKILMQKLNIDKIGFSDMLQIANGRVDSDIVSGSLKRKQSLSSQAMSLNKQNQVEQIDNMIEASVVNNFQDYGSYIKDQFNQNECRQVERNKYYLKKINQILTLEQLLEERNIFDLSLRRKLREEKDKIMIDQFDVQYDYRGKDYSKKSKTKKVVKEKDRSEHIRAEGLVSSAQINRLHEDILNNRSKSKQKSPILIQTSYTP